MSCGVSSRYDVDPTLLWLWCRPAPVECLAWEPPYAVGAALKSKKKKKERKHIIFMHKYTGFRIGEIFVYSTTQKSCQVDVERCRAPPPSLIPLL